MCVLDSVTLLQPSLYSVDNAVVAVAFHPLSDDHVVVLSEDGVRFYCVADVRWVPVPTPALQTVAVRCLSLMI